jgi:hypothetical protein
MTNKSIKKEDYRNITPYWCNKLLLYNGETKSKKFWESLLYADIKIIMNLFEKEISFKKFTTNIMTLGYPKSTDMDRILMLEHKGIEIREGNPEWGAEEGKLYFVIKHGEII